MRPIDADTLMPSFIKKANTLKDLHGVKLGEEWLLNYNDIKDVIDNAPTVEPYQGEECVNIKMSEEEIKQFKQMLQEHTPLYTTVRLNERPQGEWIPVSERLPDRFGDALVTFQKPNREPIVYRAVYVNGKFDLDNGDTWNWNDPEIKAWMPIPEAYKEAENVSKN